MHTASYNSKISVWKGKYSKCEVIASLKRQMYPTVHVKWKQLHFLPIRPFSRAKVLLVNMHSNATIWKTLFTVLWVPTMRIYLRKGEKKPICVSRTVSCQTVQEGFTCTESIAKNNKKGKKNREISQQNLVGYQEKKS